MSHQVPPFVRGLNPDQMIILRGILELHAEVRHNANVSPRHAAVMPRHVESLCVLLARFVLGRDQDAMSHIDYERSDAPDQCGDSEFVCRDGRIGWHDLFPTPDTRRKDP